MSAYASPADDLQQIKEKTERNGFCLVTGFFSSAEIESLEAALAAADAEYGKNAPEIYSISALRWVLSDPRVLSIARRLLGDDLVYYRRSVFDYEAAPGPRTANPFMEFHCDARGLPNDLMRTPTLPPGQIYPAYRFAVYFRDYAQYSGGLKVAPGSHLQPSDDYRNWHSVDYLNAQPRAQVPLGARILNIPHPSFPLHNIPSRRGDLVIFNLRTFHSAGALRFKENPDLALLPSVELSVRNAAPDMLIETSPGPRNALFFDYASPSQETDLYIKWCAFQGTRGLGNTRVFSRDACADFMMRNDILIAEYAQFLAHQSKKHSFNVRDIPMEGAPYSPAVAGLIALCDNDSGEFSPYYSLFNRDEYKAARGRNPQEAAAYVVSSIKANDPRSK